MGYTLGSYTIIFHEKATWLHGFHNLQRTFCILLIYIAKWGASAHGRPVERPPAQIIQPTACVQGQKISKGSPQLSNLGILTDSQLHHISAESVSSSSFKGGLSI